MLNFILHLNVEMEDLFRCSWSESQEEVGDMYATQETETGEVDGSIHNNYNNSSEEFEL